MKWEVMEFVRENKYVTNMNDYVKKHKIKNYGLEEEIELLIKGLSKLKKSNILILGKAGIGKTSVVEKLAELINENKVPVMLQGKTILELSLNGSLAGAQYRGSFEERIQSLLNFITERDDIILFIDEIHTLMDCNSNDGNIGLSEILKPYLAREGFSLIGATTQKEYEKTIATDSALNRRFSKIKMEEPNSEKVLTILQKCKTPYEKHYGIKLTKADLQKIIDASIEREGTFPDKAFDELEDYCYIKSMEVIENDNNK